MESRSVGNSPIFAMATHRELQPPLSWHDTRITINQQLGSFTAADRKFLFVCNNEDECSAGFPLKRPEPLPVPPIGLLTAEMTGTSIGQVSTHGRVMPTVPGLQQWALSLRDQLGTHLVTEDFGNEENKGRHDEAVDDGVDHNNTALSWVPQFMVDLTWTS